MNKALLLFTLSCVIVLGSCNLLRPSPQKVFDKNKVTAPYDVIIVPGVPYNGEHWSGTMKIRVHWSKYLYDNGYSKNIIYSGGAVYSEYVEAQVMALYGEAMGIPVDNIFVDTLAEHSTENVYSSYQIAKEMGFTKIALATDPFQTNQLRKFIRKYDLPITLLPIVIDTMVTIDRYEPTINAESAKKKGFISIEERETLFQRLKGTMGKQIVWHEEDLKKNRFVRKFKRKGRLISRTK
ncbi:MAG: YdcF family protein [Flavobacteriales bacterium]|nr:YdcF family protein [Flavobacteriales bacterium]